VTSYRRLAQTAAVALAVLAAAPAVAGAAADESVAYQVTPGHTGFASGGSLDRPPLDARWTRTLGVSSDYPNPYSTASTSYPLVAAGRVFVIVYDSQHAGGTLFALSSTTGETLWARGVDGSGQLAYDNGRVFLAERSGTVLGISASSGATQWAVVLPEPFQLQSPVASAGVVYVDSAWSGGNLYALNAVDGSTRWTSPFWSDATPALAGGVAYLSDDYEGATTALSSGAGSLVWTGKSQCFVGTGRAVADGARVIAPWNSGCGFVVDGATGGVLDSIASTTSPAAAGDVAVVLDGTTLQGRSLSTGLLLWQFRGDGSLGSAPVIVNETVYEGSSTGTLFAVDLRTGTQTWSGSIAPNGTTPGGSGMAAGSGLLVVTSAGTVTALESSAAARPGLDLKIDAGPDGPTSATAASLSFGSSDSTVPERCRLDASSWTPCHGTVTYSGLASGPHMFEVETVDASDGSTIGLAVRGWSIAAGLPVLGVTPPAVTTPPAGSTVTTPTISGSLAPSASANAATSAGGATPGASSTSDRGAPVASAALSRLADKTLARTLAHAVAALLTGRTHAEVRARPAVHLYSRGASTVSIRITARVGGRSLTLATAAASLPPVGARNVRLTLTPAGRTALAKPAKLSLLIRATVAPATGPSSSATASARV
jgi:outer membrane protein assembly factor BamB